MVSSGPSSPLKMTTLQAPGPGLPSGNGRPVVRLSGEVAAYAEREGVRQVELSISHTSGLALAQALAVHVS